jgi:N-succinyldiaminopimelate aminotransferase
MNPDLQRLQPYPFEKLAALKAGITPATALAHIALSIGEPQHAPPAFVQAAIRDHLEELRRYPLTRGIPALRQAIAAWLCRRYTLPAACMDPERHILPVNGTREGLFAVAQALVDRSANHNGTPLVLMPNPFYQIYEGAALLAGAEPHFYPLLAGNGYQPDFSSIADSVWRRCQLVYVCTPNNPTGCVAQTDLLQELLERSMRYNFTIVSDECYSEIYFDEAQRPPGLLQAAVAAGLTDFRNCLVFNSLSKRSNLPGLRSGFVAGDARLIETFARYRTYHGSAMSETVQQASAVAWNDEAHVVDNRRIYREKFAAALDILQPVIDVQHPQAAFFLWLQTLQDDQTFARDLYAQQNLTVLPGSYLSRTIGNHNPGERHVRIALVPETAQCLEAMRRIRAYIESL